MSEYFQPNICSLYNELTSAGERVVKRFMHCFLIGKVGDVIFLTRGVGGGRPQPGWP